MKIKKVKMPSDPDEIKEEKWFKRVNLNENLEKKWGEGANIEKR